MNIEREEKYLDACLKGGLDTVMEMIKNENKKFKNNKLLLKCLTNACEGGHSDIFNAIINYRDVASVSYHTMYSLVSCASKGGNNLIVTKLLEILESGLVPNFDPNDNLALFYVLEGACEGGKLEIFKLYAHKEKFNSYLASVCIAEACVSGNLELVKFLGDFLCDKQFSDVLNWKFNLHHACSSKNVELVRYIVDQCDENFDKFDQCLNTACFNGCIEIVEFMIENGAKCSSLCLYSACANGNKIIITMLLDMLLDMLHENNTNFDYGECNENINTWINSMGCGACDGGHLEIVNIMIENGFNNWNDGMLCACSRGYLDIVKIMAKNGATNWSNGAVRACQNDHIDILKYILTKNNSVATDYNDYLYYACRNGDINLANLLIQKGATSWYRGLSGACIGGHSEIVRMMLKYTNADVNNCLRINHAGDVDISYLLIKKGATDLDCLRRTHDLKLYCLYCFYKGHKPNNSECIDRYTALLQEYPAYILLVGSQIKKSIRKYKIGKYEKNCCIKKLPVEIFRLLFLY